MTAASCMSQVAGYKLQAKNINIFSVFKACRLWLVACSLFILNSYSHSMVEGGLEEMSKTTRLIPRTWLIMVSEIDCITL